MRIYERQAVGALLNWGDHDGDVAALTATQFCTVLPALSVDAGMANELAQESSPSSDVPIDTPGVFRNSLLGM